MIKKNIVIGSGGHARSLVSLLINNRIKNIKIKSFSKLIFKEKIFKFKIEKLNLEYDLKGNNNYFLAIGDLDVRKKYFDILKKRKKSTPNIFSKSSNVNDDLNLGTGNFIGENIFIGPYTKIGSNNIINSSCSIDHECIIGNDCNISPGVVLAGRASLGNKIFIGMGACIAENIKICNNVIIGANSFVNRSILKPGTYFGSPIRKIK